MSKGFLVMAAAMAATVTLANLLVSYQINDYLTYAAFVYPLSFLISDLSVRCSGAAFARKVVYCGFALGVILSLALAGPRIALASGLAFFCGQMTDIKLLVRMLGLPVWWLAPLISSTAAGLVDTLIFFYAAFWGSENDWLKFAAGDFSAKALMALALLPVYRLLVSRFASPVPARQ